MLYLGDCLDTMPRLPAASVDLILCDLPYGTTQNKWDSVIPLDRLWPEYWRIAKPNAAIVLTAQTPFDKVLGVSCLTYLKYEWIWEKPNPSGHLNAKIAPMKAHENILVFYKKAPTYNPQKTYGHKRKISRVDRSTMLDPCYGTQAGNTLYDSTERYPRSVQIFAS